jgi:HEAT repeat protein
MGVRTENGVRTTLLLLLLGSLLSGCGGKSTADWIGQLHAKESVQRLHAVKALAGRPAEAEVVVPALAEVLKDEDAFVRRDAARALGDIGPPAKPALPALLPALRDQHAPVRQAAAEALRKIDPEAAARAGVR